MPNLTGAEIEELENLIELTTVRGWKILRNLLTNHRQHCLEQSHKYLRQGEDRKAGEWLARADEPKVLQELVHNRKQELSKRKEES